MEQDKVGEDQKRINASIIQQVSVFMENQPGKLAEILEVLRGIGVNIRALSIAEAGDFGIIRMVADNADTVYETLKESGYTVSVTEVLMVEVRGIDEIEIYSVARKLSETDINIEYAYSFSGTSNEKTKLVLRVKDPKRAVKTIVSDN